MVVANNAILQIIFLINPPFSLFPFHLIHFCLVSSLFHTRLPFNNILPSKRFITPIQCCITLILLRQRLSQSRKLQNPPKNPHLLPNPRTLPPNHILLLSPSNPPLNHIPQNRNLPTMLPSPPQHRRPQIRQQLLISTHISKNTCFASTFYALEPR